MRTNTIVSWKNYYIDISEKYALSAHNPYYVCYHWLCRAEGFIETKQYNKAISQIVKTKAQLEKYRLQQTNYYQYAFRYLGDIKREQQQLDSAIYFYKRSFERYSKILDMRHSEFQF